MSVHTSVVFHFHRLLLSFISSGYPAVGYFNGLVLISVLPLVILASNFLPFATQLLIVPVEQRHVNQAKYCTGHGDGEACSTVSRVRYLSNIARAAESSHTCLESGLIVGCLALDEDITCDKVGAITQSQDHGRSNGKTCPATQVVRHP